MGQQMANQFSVQGGSFGGETVRQLTEKESAAAAEWGERQRELEELAAIAKARTAKPEWWHERNKVPPLEPFDRFLGWIDLELRSIRMKMLGIEP
jgi:hypothetical protein